jgi:hypothetical protein
MINIALLKSKRAIYIKRATEIVKNADEVAAVVNARIQRFGEYRKEG